MSFRKKCERYFKKRNRKIDRLLDKVSDGYDTEDYHELRVEIKKIKALMKMAAHVARVNEKKILKPYRRVFKSAGLVRDAQMAGELLQKERSLKWLEQYRNDLKTEAELHEKDFQLLMDKKLRGDLAKAHKAAKGFSENLDRAEAKKYLEKEERKIKDLLGAGRTSIEDAHRLRKKLKRIGYMESLMKINRVRPKVEAIQEELGTWHDHCELAARLRRDAAKQPDKQRKLHMHYLQKELDARAKKKFAKIGLSLRKMRQAKLKSPTLR